MKHTLGLLSCAVAILSLFLSGCTTLEDAFDSSTLGPFHTIQNFKLAGGQLPDELRRVAVLPLLPARGSKLAEHGSEHLQAVLTDELSRSGLFSVLTITPEKLHGLSGQRAVRAEDPLPFNFLETLKSETECQAVLFCELSVYQPYPPISVGWKFHLFDIKTGELLWSFDEVFDAGKPTVANSCRRYTRQSRLTSVPATKEGLVIDSPSTLARYGLDEAINTMKKTPKVVQSSADTSSNRQSDNSNPKVSKNQ
ncbi:MAG: hypothetical protein EXS24_05925 [Pedosphaera sp.]|nr:hypothetical protein [Pedosphaera sp.]